MYRTRLFRARAVLGETMRGFLKVAVLSVGILAALLGIWWVCQGTGLVPVGLWRTR
jgi:hypothetical protein